MVEQLPSSEEEEEAGHTNWNNVRVISVFTFVDSLQFAIFTWSLWPFVQQLHVTMDQSFTGLVLSFSGLGEALAAPLLGYWSNKAGRILPPIYSSLLLSAAGNSLYLFIPVMPAASIPYALICSRFFTGTGTGNRSCFRALVAAQSEGTDRAKALASSGGAALLGLTIGPAAQLLFIWMGERSYDLGGVLLLSQYTAPALLALVANISSGIYIRLFLDDRLTRPNSDPAPKQSLPWIVSRSNFVVNSSFPSARVDLLVVFICMATRAMRMFATANIESVGSSFSEIEFGFSKETAMQWNAWAQALLAAVTLVVFLVYACTDYTKWVSERTNCFVALLGLLVFYAVTLPWPFLSGHVDCSRFIGNDTHNWKWCATLRPVNRYVFYLLYAMCYGVAISVLNNSLQALFSRVLGNSPQGTMQGISQAVGSISRVLGPVVMASAFDAHGPAASWGVALVLILLTITVWALFFHRMLPRDCKPPPVTISPQNTS